VFLVRIDLVIYRKTGKIVIFENTAIF